MTLLDLITVSLKDIGAFNFGDTLDAEEASDAVTILNMVANELDTEGFWAYATTRESFTLVVGQDVYTWGVTTPASDFTTARPVRVLNCFVRDGSSDYTVDLTVGMEQYESIVDKSITGRPEMGWVNFTYPAATIYLSPVPDAAYPIYFDTEKDLIDFSTLTATISLPGPHLQALRLGLAFHLCPSYKKYQIMPIFEKMYMDALRTIKRQNAANKVQPVRLMLPTVRPEESEGTILSF